jgi:hypothetical protein
MERKKKRRSPPKPWYSEMADNLTKSYCPVCEQPIKTTARGLLDRHKAGTDRHTPPRSVRGLDNHLYTKRMTKRFAIRCALGAFGAVPPLASHKLTFHLSP